jgi:hypothetical protein
MKMASAKNGLFFVALKRVYGVTRRFYSYSYSYSYSMRSGVTSCSVGWRSLTSKVRVSSTFLSVCGQCFLLYYMECLLFWEEREAWCMVTRTRIIWRFGILLFFRAFFALQQHKNKNLPLITAYNSAFEAS